MNTDFKKIMSKRTYEKLIKIVLICRDRHQLLSIVVTENKIKIRSIVLSILLKHLFLESKQTLLDTECAFLLYASHNRLCDFPQYFSAFNQITIDFGINEYLKGRWLYSEWAKKYRAKVLFLKRPTALKHLN